MKKLYFTSLLVFAIAGFLSFSSCSGCVKKTTKKATELGMSAMEGAIEAIDENGEKLAEKTTSAAGKVALGVGRSLDKQLDEHATKIASSAGRTLVQTVDGLDSGITDEVKSYYNILPYTENFPSGVAMDFIGIYKQRPVVDAYFIIKENGKYSCKFEFSSTDGRIYLTKDAEIVVDEHSKNRSYQLVSFALNSTEEAAMKDLKNVVITVK